LRDQAIRDPLTGLFNRRYMEEAIHRELYRTARKKAKVGFVLFDLDHFKKFNDRFGHNAGDATLRDVSAFVQKNSRAEDILCRYGGEEFLLVLSDCSSKVLIERAEQIREGVKKLRLGNEQRPLGDITLSIGAALFPDHGRTLEELFQAADAALYQAKRAGRDRVAVADPLRLITVPGRSPEKESEH
jgi:diguanylate cyclase (GGDEF)-like protein